MPSILPNYEYDIFISYRQNDNKRDGWVTNFVAALKDELEATLKNPVSIYFDENPHDGLLETHQVTASLEKKLKCLVFIPIISQTYCDIKSYAWTQEFLPFVEMAKEDDLGMNITLSNGNVVSRVLPVRIHDLEIEDQAALEAILNGPLRPIDFIYREPGVNSPLKPDDDRNRNLENTDYKYQLNKVANSLKDIGKSIIKDTEPEPEQPMARAEAPLAKKGNPALRMIVGSILIPILFALAFYSYRALTEKSSSSVILEKSIAILPFTNTKPNTETDYLGFAIANQIIGELDYNKSITVRPASAIRKYDQEVFETSSVAEDLKVNYVLAGTYLMVDDKIRLEIELLNAHDNEGVWRDNLEVDFSNAFDLQDIVAQKVVNGLDVRFSQNELEIKKADISSSPLAYEYYLRSLSYPLSIKGSTLAIEMLKKSVSLDSTYAPAYTQIADRANRILVYGTIAERSDEDSESNLLKALALNENQLGALTLLGARYVERGHTDDAVTTIRKALRINPNSAETHFYLGYLYRYAGMLKESIMEMEKALSLYPGNPKFRSLGLSYFYAGEYNKAFEALSLDSGTLWEIGWQVIFNYNLEEYDMVITLAEKARKMDEGTQWMYTIDAFLAALHNDNLQGVSLARLLEEANLDVDGSIIDSESAYHHGVTYAINGDRDGAIRSLKSAVENGFFCYPFMVSDKLFEPLKGDKEYQEILTLAKEKHLAFKEKFFSTN